MTTSPQTRFFALGAALAFAALVWTPGCSSPTSNLAGFGEARDMPGCTLAVRKCSRCHESERIFAYPAPTPGFWPSLVDRMRRKRGSNISPDTGKQIAECLVVRSFGKPGLESLQRGTDADENQP